MSKFELTHKTLDAQYIERFFLGTPSSATHDQVDDAVNDYK